MRKNNQVKKLFRGLWKVLMFPSLRAILIVLIVLLLFKAVDYAVAPSKIDEGLRQAMAESSGKIMKIEVQFGFTPEDFHIKTMQNYGAMAGVADESIYLMYVTNDQIKGVSRIYWVKNIKLP